MAINIKVKLVVISLFAIISAYPNKNFGGINKNGNLDLSTPASNGSKQEENGTMNNSVTLANNSFYSHKLDDGKEIYVNNMSDKNGFKSLANETSPKHNDFASTQASIKKIVDNATNDNVNESSISAITTTTSFDTLLASSDMSPYNVSSNNTSVLPIINITTTPSTDDLILEILAIPSHALGSLAGGGIG